MLWLWVEAMLPLLLAAFMVIAVLTSVHGGSIGVFILLGCLVGLLLWHWIDSKRGNSHIIQMRHFEATAIGDIESDPTQNHFLIVRVRNQRQPPSSQNLNLLSLVPKAHIASLAMRALPPVLCFQGDQTTQSHHTDCSICMEEFKNGELVQPFGVCLHQFHLYCINSWLLVGKTNCPVCRKELSIATQTTH